MNNTEAVSFQLISIAGDAMGKLFEAMAASKKCDMTQAHALIQEGRVLLNEAHNAQTSLLVADANGDKTEVNVLLIHAQDTLMNTVLAETFVNEIIALNDRINQLETKLEKIMENKS
jgi:PTS system cellobiose-specific IIA component/PTS system lactose-specific IIA component